MSYEADLEETLKNSFPSGRSTGTAPRQAQNVYDDSYGSVYAVQSRAKLAIEQESVEAARRQHVQSVLGLPHLQAAQTARQQAGWISKPANTV